MSSAIKFLKGRFGRVALLQMDAPLVTHAHHHCHVLIKTSGADAAFRVGGRLCPLTDTQAVLVNAWEPHAYVHHPPDGTSPTGIFALYIEPSWLGELQRPLSLSSHPRFFPQPVAQVTERVRRLAEDLAMRLLGLEGCTDERVESMLAELMIAVIEPFSYWRRSGSLLPAELRVPQDGRIRRAMSIMRENVGVELDMDVLASQCGLSRAHFFELFRRTTRLTPAMYVNELRMEAAFEGLARSPDAITSIAYRLGFSAPGHFTRFFRSHIGITPSEYRKVVDVYGSGQRSLAV